MQSFHHPHKPSTTPFVLFLCLILLLPNVAPIVSLCCGKAKLSRACMGTKVYPKSINTHTAFKSADFQNLSKKHNNITPELLDVMFSVGTFTSSLDKMIVGCLTAFSSSVTFETLCRSSGAFRDEDLFHPPSHDRCVARVPSEMRLAFLKCSSMIEVVSIFLLVLKAILVSGEISSRS